MKKIGIIFGMENTFPQALVERINGMKVEGISAEFVKLTGTRPFAKVVIVKDNRYVYTSEPKTATVDFTWKDNAAKAGGASYYYVRGEQDDGNIVWVSPMWITFTGK